MERPRILLIDDEPSLTEVFRLLLEGTGRFVVAEENGGSSALAAARLFQPHLIFLDMDLPDKHGLEIASELREEVGLAEVPVVFLTGALTRQEARERGIEGRGPALAKPFCFTEMLQMTDQLLAPPLAGGRSDR